MIPAWRDRIPADSSLGAQLVAMQAEIDDYKVALTDTEKQLNALPEGDIQLLGARLADMLESDRWNNIEPYLEAVRIKLATLENETIERCVQLCLLERDKADKRKPDPPGSTMNVDHIRGQGCMANLLAKKLRALKKEK